MNLRQHEKRVRQEFEDNFLLSIVLAHFLPYYGKRLPTWPALLLWQWAKIESKSNRARRIAYPDSCYPWATRRSAAHLSICSLTRYL